MSVESYKKRMSCLSTDERINKAHFQYSQMHHTHVNLSLWEQFTYNQRISVDIKTVSTI